MSSESAANEERWIDWTSRPYQFVPLNQYDETQKLSEIAVGEMLAEIKRLQGELDDAEGTLDAIANGIDLRGVK